MGLAKAAAVKAVVKVTVELMEELLVSLILLVLEGPSQMLYLQAILSSSVS